MSLSFPTSCRTAVGACALLGLALTGCGGGKPSNDSLSGKVTLNGQPVAGQVVFVSNSDSKETPTVISPTGDYSVALAKGEYQILVKGTGLAAPVVPKG